MEDHLSTKRQVDEFIRKGHVPDTSEISRLLSDFQNEFKKANKRTLKGKAARSELVKTLNMIASQGWMPRQDYREKKKSYLWDGIWEFVIKQKDMDLLEALIRAGAEPIEASKGSWRHTPIGGAIYHSWGEGAIRIARLMTPDHIRFALSSYGEGFMLDVCSLVHSKQLPYEDKSALCSIWKQNGWTPSHHEGENIVQFAEAGDLSILLSCGLDPNGTEGQPLFHVLCANSSFSYRLDDHKAKGELLISHGCDIFRKDARGMTAMDTALANACNGFVEWLRPIWESWTQKRRLSGDEEITESMIQDSIRILLASGYSVSRPDGTMLSKKKNEAEAGRPHKTL